MAAEKVSIYMHTCVDLDRVGPVLRKKARQICRAKDLPDAEVTYIAADILRREALAALGRVATRVGNTESPFVFSGDRAKIAAICERQAGVDCFA